MVNLVSIIIPCYNQGHYIEEALDSIDKSSLKYPIEIIIVNDGSTNEQTIKKLAELAKNEHILLINQKNMGLAIARNVGITHAKGNYILPLDADNKITSEYINKAVAKLLEGCCDIVYGEPIFFGEDIKRRKYKSQNFNIYDLLERNYIDACAIFTKDVWIKNKGYDNYMPIKGYEDWEFWINAYSNGFSFFFLKQPLFYYRITENSMVDSYSKEKFMQVHHYLIQKHTLLFLQFFIKLSYIKRKYDTDIQRWYISPFIFLFYLLKIIKKPDQKAAVKFSHYLLK